MGLRRWLVAFVFTQAIEIPVYLAAMRRQRLAQGSAGERPLPRLDHPAMRGFAAFGASALTHPIVWFIIPRLLAGERYWTMTAVAEVFAVATEAVFLGAFGLRQPLLWAFVANALSAGLGLALRSVWGVP